MKNDKSPWHNLSSPPLLNSPIFISIIMFISFLTISWHNLPAWNVDNAYYINVFQFIPVRRPFSVRILYPNIARLIMNISGVTLAQSFIIANSIALLLLLLVISYLIKKITSNTFLAVPMLFNPLLLRSFQEAYIPDLFFLCLVSIYFLLIYHSYYRFSLLTLLLLFITRDDVILLFVSIILVNIYLSGWKFVLLSVLVMLIGLAINSFTALYGLPSPANMNPLLFYLIRIPSNLFYNFTGIPIWSNIYSDICNPIIKINLPIWRPFGNLHSVGLCPINLTTPFRNISFFLTTLGVLPSLLIYDLVNNYKSILKSTPLFTMIALVYGVICFLSAGGLSMDIMRHVGEAWPAVWLAMIALLPLHYKIDKKFIYRMSICNLIVSWAPWIIFLHKVKPTFFYQFSLKTLPIFILIVLFSIFGHYYAINAMRNQAKLT